MATKSKTSAPVQAADVPFEAPAGSAVAVAAQDGFAATDQEWDGAAPVENRPEPAPAKTSAAKARVAYAIVDNVPMPDSKRGRREAIYPFNDLTVGQMFFVPATEEQPEPWRNMASIASRASRTTWPKRFESRQTTIDGKSGVGIWRVADATGDKPAPKEKDKKADDKASD